MKEVAVRTPKDRPVYKVSYFPVDFLIKIGVLKDTAILINPTMELLNQLYIDLRKYLEVKDKYVFNPFYGWRAKVTRGNKLKEFGVEFKHIE